MNSTKTEETNQTKVVATIFTAPPDLNKIMNAVDLTDNRTKVFGSFGDLTFTTTSKVDETYKQNLVKKLIQLEEVYYAQCDSYFILKPGIHALSLGTHFIWVQDLRQQQLEVDMKEVKLDDNNDNQ